MSFELNDNCKRLTWRLATETHNKMKALVRQTGLSQEEVVNVIILGIPNDVLKPKLEEFIRIKRNAEAKKKKASDAVSRMPNELLDRLSDLSPEEIQKLLNQ